MNKFENVTIVQGSSSLLAHNVLPVGKSEAVARFDEQFTVAQLVEAGCDEEEAVEFYSRFADQRIKKGCLDNVPAMFNKLLGRAGVKVSKPTPATEPIKNPPTVFDQPVTPVQQAVIEGTIASLKKPVAETVRSVLGSGEVVPFIYEAHSVPEDDLYVFQTNMSRMSSYSQQLGISGHGKGTRLSTLLEFFKYLGYKFEVKSVNVTANGVTNKRRAGVHCPELNMFILGTWVSGRLYSWSSTDTFTGPGLFWTMMEMVHKWGGTNFLQEGYVAAFSGQLFSPNLHRFGYKNIHKIGYEYDTKEQLLERVFERKGEYCKGDSAWKQNALARKVIDEEIGYVNKFPNAFDNTFYEMYKFDADVGTYGRTYLQFVGAPDSIKQEFEVFIAKYDTRRIHNDKLTNIKRFGWTYQEHNRLYELSTPSMETNQDTIDKSAYSLEVGIKLLEDNERQLDSVSSEV